MHLRKLNYKIVIAFCFSIGLMACEKKKDDPLSTTPDTFKGVLSFNLSISSSPTCGEALSLYTTEYQNAYTFGARGAQTAAPWSSLEDDGTVEAGENADGFSLTMVSNSFFGLNAIEGYGFTHIL